MRRLKRPRWAAPPGSDLAALRQQGHRLIDLKLEFGGEEKTDVYADLAIHMGLRMCDCQFGMFDEEQCRQAIAILSYESEAT
jgi:hypothetical protein